MDDRAEFVFNEPNNKDEKKRKIFLIAAAGVLVVAIVISAVLIFGNAQASDNAERILEFGTLINGVSIGGIDISGMTAQEARAATELLPDILIAQTRLSFDIDGALIALEAQDLGFATDYEDIFNDVVKFGRTGSFEERVLDIKAAGEGGGAFEIRICADEASVQAALVVQYDKFNNDPRNATYIFMPNGYLEDGTQFEPGAFSGKAIEYPDTLVRIPEEQMPNPLRYQYWKKTKYIKDTIPTDANISRFLYIEEEKGLNTDMDDLGAQIIKAVENADFSTVIVASTHVTEPVVTLEQVKERTQLVSSWTTWYGHSSNKNRASNVGLLASKINGTILEPNVRWSINKDIGLRTVAGGFKPAGALSGGRMIEDDVGGGVCQVSSTLFNAAIRSDIRTPEHNRHTIPSVYLPMALDAAISSSPDLALLNEHDVPMYVVSYMDFKNKNITFEIYGPTVVHETYGDVILDFDGKETGTGPEPATKHFYNSTVTPDGKPITEYKSVVFVKPRAATYCRAYIIYRDLTGKELEKKTFYDDSYRAFIGQIYYNHPEGWVPGDDPPSEEGGEGGAG
ncbi:MAG: VanW family protein [Christensenellales bacterium]